MFCVVFPETVRLIDVLMKFSNVTSKEKCETFAETCISNIRACFLSREDIGMLKRQIVSL